MKLLINSTSKQLIRYEYTEGELAESHSHNSEGALIYSFPEGTECVSTDTYAEIGDIESSFPDYCDRSPNLSRTMYYLNWDGEKLVGDDVTLNENKLGPKWSYIRGRRDSMLSDTDWIVTKAKETGTNISAAWKTYRQELRDITEQSDPDNITWPTKPS